MSRQSILAKKFTAAITATAFVFGVAEQAGAVPPPSSKPRELTAGEYEMIKIFGAEVDPKIVRLHAGPSKGNVAGESFDPSNVAMYGHPYLSLDYSKEKDPFNWGLFFHETTHTWQFQTGWTYTKGHCPGGYVYRLNTKSKFTDFCSESQGAIVEDYSRRFLKPESSPSHWYKETCGKDTIEHDALLLKVVERRFPAAREMRLKLGRGEQLPDAVKRDENAPACPTKDQEDEGFVAKKGQPVYFCETLAYAFTNIKGMAFKSGLPAWPGFEAVLDKKEPVCKVAIYGSNLVIIGGKDFGPNGQMKGPTTQQLVTEIVKYTPQGIIGEVQSNLSTLFDNLVDKQKAERKALSEIKSREEAEDLLERFEKQLKEDPSLPDNSRGFVEEKVRILKEILRKMGKPDAQPTQPQPPEPQPDGGDKKGGDKKQPVGGPSTGNGGNGNGSGDKGKGGGKPDGTTGGTQPDASNGNGRGGDRKSTGDGKPPVKKADSSNKPLNPDSNIKDILDSAFGKSIKGGSAPKP